MYTTNFMTKNAPPGHTSFISERCKVIKTVENTKALSFVFAEVN